MPERNATRSVPIVVCRYWSLTIAICCALRLAAVERAEGRQAAHHVEEVRREERERLPALACPPLRVAAHEPHEHRDERQRQEHHAGRDEVDRRDEREHRDRHDERQDDLREIARERRLESIDPRDGGRSYLGALGSLEGGRLAPQPRLDEIETKLGEHVGCRPPAHGLEAPGRQAPAGGGRGEERERRCDVSERGAVERTSCDPSQEHRLGQDEQSCDDRERDVGSEDDPYRPRPAQEARVEAAHYSAGFRARMSAGLRTVSPPSRARKTR